MLRKKSGLLGAISIFLGTAIGAGVFGIPFVFSKAGFFVGCIHLCVLGAIMILVSIAYGEVCLRTKGKHQLIGYAGLYAGKKGRILAWLALFLGIYSALVAYTIEVGVFLHAVLSPWWGGSPFIYSLIFFTIMALALFIGLKSIVWIDKIMVLLLLTIIGVLFLFGMPKIDLNHLITFDSKNILLPYGVILFALGAASAIPTMKEILQGQLKKLKMAISFAAMIPILVYALFAFVVVGVNGASTTEGAIIGLSSELGNTVLVLGSILGILAMTTSFASLGLVLKEAYQYDFKLSKTLSWFLVLIVPLVIFILNFMTFVEILGFAGAIIGGFEGIIIIMIHQKAKKQGQRNPEYSIEFPKIFRSILYCVFILGIFYEIMYIAGII